MTALLQGLAADRRVFPHQLDLLNDNVLLVQLSEADLRDHSFLDQRILRPGMAHEWTAWATFSKAALALPDKVPAYIFHAGHCGSTLLSRLVSAATGAEALREPLPMRTLAFDAADAGAALLADDARRKRLRLFERVWARGPVATVVKATSICTNLMATVADDAPLVFIYQQPAVQLAVVLAGENSELDLRGFAQNRYRRLLQVGLDLPPLAAFSVGELAALAWLAEVASAAPALAARQVLTVDFDLFLEQPAGSLAEVCRHVGLDANPDRVRSAIEGPVMRRYSKAPEYDYGPALRNDVIADSQRRNAAEIARGLQWIERMTGSVSEIDAAVARLSP